MIIIIILKNVAGDVRFSNYAKIFDDMCNIKKR